jgi:NAD(P)-dependent dehydrogenase (short-subunit alcohol dehydrogenase family)
MRLRGKVALLTGAVAAIKGKLMGFGGAAAHLFVREGAKSGADRHPRRSGRARGGSPDRRGPAVIRQSRWHDTAADRSVRLDQLTRTFT